MVYNFTKNIGTFFLLLLLLTSTSCTYANESKAERKSKELTIYSNGMSLVEDERHVVLSNGSGTLHIDNVSENIIPESTRLLNGPKGFEVEEQIFQYDTANQTSILKNYLGKNIQLLDRNEFQDAERIIDAKLISLDGGPIYEIDGSIYLGYPGITVLPALPEKLVTEPTLLWEYQSAVEGPSDIVIQYLTTGLSWKMDYALDIEPNQSEAVLTGWVTVNNQTGVEYDNSSLSLIAGDMNRVSSHGIRKSQPRMMAMAMADESVGSAASFAQESFSDFYEYHLKRVVDLPNRESKQILFSEPRRVEVDRMYEVRGHFRSYRDHNEHKMPVAIKLNFKNKDAMNNADPLPAGIIRVYEKNSKGRSKWAGESRINHKARGEEIEIGIGNAFDLKAIKRQKDYKQLGKQLFESEWQIVLENHQNKAVTIDVYESLSMPWRMIQNSHSYVKENAQLLKFSIDVAPNSETTLTYRIQSGNGLRN